MLRLLKTCSGQYASAALTHSSVSYRSRLCVAPVCVCVCVCVCVRVCACVCEQDRKVCVSERERQRKIKRRVREVAFVTEAILQPDFAGRWLAARCLLNQLLGYIR